MDTDPKSLALADAWNARRDDFLRAVIAEDPHALTKCPLYWAARHDHDSPLIRVELASGAINVVGFGPTLTAASLDAIKRSPSLRARMIELEACP